MEKELTNWDKEYLKLCKIILTEGVEVENRTGTNTIKVPAHHFHLDIGKEFPILTTKELYIRQAVLEMLWIYQVQSNDVNWLKERNIHIWDEWQADENGDYIDNDGTIRHFGKDFANTIGTAYGYIVGKDKLIDNLLYKLKYNPTDRRGVMSLWQNDYLKTAVLPSCVWSSMWDVTDNKLNAVVTQRSCDVPLGLPFNVTQYSVLLYLLAKEAGLKPGTLDWMTKDAHIYLDQIDGIKEQIKREEIYNKYKELSIPELLLLKEKIQSLPKGERLYEETDNENVLKIISMLIYPTKPELWLNPEVECFYDYDNSKECKDIKIKNYKNMGKISFPLAR